MGQTWEAALPVTYDLANKTAVVTGGAKGIGRTISERLHGAGARVWSWDIDPAPSDHIAQISVDVTNPGHIERAIERVIAETSRIDILVNNAGSRAVPPRSKLSSLTSGGASSR